MSLLAATFFVACADNLPTSQEKLRSGVSPLIRVGAAERLGEIGCEEAVRTLTLNGLRDQSPMVRAASARALIGSDHPQVIDLMGDLLLDPDVDVRKAAAGALAANRGDKARRYLELGYSRSGSQGRVIIGEAIVAAGASPRKTIEEMASRRLQRNLTILETGTFAERLGAIHELGWSGRPDAVAALTVQLGHPSLQIATAAAKALGDSGERRAVPALASALDENDLNLRKAVLSSLGRLEEPSVIERVTPLTLEEGAGVALKAIDTLTRLGDGEEVAEALCRVTLSSNDPATAASAARHLLPLLAEHECDVTPRLRRDLARDGSAARTAIALMGALGDALATDEERDLLAALLRHDDLQVRSEALDAVVALGMTGVAEEVRGELRARLGDDLRVRERWVSTVLPARFGWGDDGAAYAAAGSDSEQTGRSAEARYRGRYDDLMERLADYRADIEVKRLAALGLPETDVEQAKERHLEALGSDEPSRPVRLFADLSPAGTRYLAALTRAALTLSGDPSDEVLADARRLLEHPEPEVVLAAVEGLGVIDRPEALRLLESAISPSQDDDVLVAAAIALAKRGAPMATMTPALGFAGPLGVRGVIRALAMTGDEEAVEHIVALLDRPASREAARALASIGGERATDALIAHLERAVDAPGMADLLELFGNGARDPRVAPLARRGLHSEWPEIRAASARYLRRAGIQEPWLEALRGDYDARVRHAASSSPH